MLLQRMKTAVRRMEKMKALKKRGLRRKVKVQRALKMRQLKVQRMLK